MFLTIEGIEGCGKTTQAGRLVDYLRGRGLRVTATREPGGSPVGAELRSLLLSEDYDLSPEAELLLYAAERAEHVAFVIRPAIARGEWVVCDRFGDATRAYQSFGRGLPREQVEAAHAIATGGLEPELTILLELPVAEGLGRALERNNAAATGEGRFEAEPADFHEKVARGYKTLAAEYPGRIVTIPAKGSISEVFGRVREVLEKRFGL